MKNRSAISFKRIDFELSILYIVIFFSTTLSIIYSSLKFMIIIFPIVLVLHAFLNCLVSRNKISNVFALFVFIFYGLISIPIFFILSDVNYLYTPFIGFINIYLYLILWYFLFNSQYGFCYVFDINLKLLIFVAVVMSIGALVQYFLSPTIFGMTSNEIYAQNLSDKVNINKRAISFISSPQSLSLFLSISLIVGYYKIRNKIYKFFILGLLTLAGLLTFSKIFILVTLTFIFVNFLININLVNIIKILIITLIIYFTFLNFSYFSRAFEILDILSNLTSYVTFLIWMDFLNYNTSISQFLFGHGIGLVSRASQTLGNYSILNGSTESFLLQLYFEIGIVGLLVFLFLYIKSIINLYSITEYKEYSILMVSFLPSMIGTPAFYGLTNNFILSFFLISGLIINKKDHKK